jgi:hypothetical protein
MSRVEKRRMAGGTVIWRHDTSGGESGNKRRGKIEK